MAADSVIDGCVMGNKRHVLKAAIDLQQLAFEDTTADAVCRGGGGGEVQRLVLTLLSSKAVFYFTSQ